MSETETYGKKIDYDPLWTGPMTKERTPTDIGFLKFLAGFCVVWLGIAIYAYSSGNLKALHDVASDVHFDENDYVRTYEFDTIQMKTYRSSNTYYKVGFITFNFIVFSAVLCTAFLLLLRWFVKFIVYTFIVFAFTIIFSVTCIAAAESTRSGEPKLYCVFIICAAFFVALLVLFIVHRKKIDISCEVIREASKCVIFFPTALVFPLFPFFIYVGITIFTLTIFINLVSIANEYHETPGHITLFYIFNLFGYLWLGSFVKGFSQMILSGTFATWYWTQNKIYVPSYSLFHFMETTIKNHLGTLAFGSLIMALCQFVKMLLKSLKKIFQGKCSPCFCCCFGFYQYFFENLEKIVRYINRNAYIMCAIHGKSFLESAKNAFNLLMRNFVKVIIINKMTDVILFFGQILTISLSVLSALIYCKNENLADQEVSIVLGTIFVISSLVTFFFFMVLRTAIDTIFLCVLEDYERNDGSDERPYFMSFKLKHLFLDD